MLIRQYRPADRDAVYDICLRTGAAGNDATALYQDKDLLPDIFAGPYLHLEPELAFVLDNGERAVGYILGTADTPRFVEAYRQKWLPLVGDRYPLPAGEPRTPDEQMTFLLHHPERMALPQLAGYPAHLHIDLLPAYQRGGYGRQLMHTLFGALDKAGVTAIHLSMLTVNTPARAFYDRLGFHEIPVPYAGEVTYLGRSTAIPEAG